MLQAHSFLWHFLWIVPNLLLFCLGLLMRKRGIHKRFPAFVAFAFLASLGQLLVYAADVVPSITPTVYWRIVWADLLSEAGLKFLVLAEIFAQIFGGYSSIARIGKILIRTVAASVVLLSTFAAAYAPRDGAFAIISGANFLEQAIYIIECALLAFIVLFSAYFHLAWDRIALGITLGLSISACVHLAIYAVLLNTGLPDSARNGFIFVKMAAYNLCVLLWCYYLLTKGKATSTSPAPLPENNLALWNRELERLLQ